MQKLLENVQKHITTDSFHWKTFLKTATKFSQYDFHDQLLIFAQQPEKNKTIALLDFHDITKKPFLHYISDIMPTDNFIQTDKNHTAILNELS